jgi:hypothetical protein
MLEVIPELLLDNYTIDMGGMGVFFAAHQRTAF